MPRRTRLVVATAAILFAASPSLAHERCGCRGEVLNGRLNTADFDGGVGDRTGDGGAYGGGGYVIAYGDASSASGAFAAARASAFASASSHAFAHGGGHGGGMHGHGGGSYGGHH
jgi:hypothetical protein